MATVALLQKAHSRHRASYLEALRDLDEVTAAAIVDPDGVTFEEAKRILHNKPVRTYATFEELRRGPDGTPAPDRK